MRNHRLYIKQSMSPGYTNKVKPQHFRKTTLQRPSKGKSRYFKPYPKNINLDSIAQEDYLKQGTQTRLTDLVYQHIENIRKNIKKNLRGSLIHETCKYIHNLTPIKGYIPNAKTNKDKEFNIKLKNSVFRQRNLHQILDEGYFPSCSDIGLLFRGLVIAQGIPTAYLETFHEDYILDKKPRGSKIIGHVFGKVFLGDSSIIIDPSQPIKVYHNELQLFNDKGYVPFKEGLDSWDIGIYSVTDLDKIKKENLTGILDKYESLLTQNYHAKMNNLKEKKTATFLRYNG